MTTIHPLTARDKDEWMPLWRGYLTFYRHELSDEQTDLTFTRLVENTTMHGALARDDGGTAIGLVHWLTHGSTWEAGEYTYLEDLFVASDARGHGAGAALIAFVARWGEQHGSPRVYWHTHESNATARALYDRVARHSGFVRYTLGQ